MIALMPKYIKLAGKGIKRKRMRSFLTIVGIAVGVLLIVTVISLSEGTKNAVLNQLRLLGTDLIYVVPGKGTSTFLFGYGGISFSDKDDNNIKNIIGVKRTCPMVLGALQVKYKNERNQVLFCAHPAECNEILKETQAWGLEEGRYYKDGENKVLVGKTLADDFFDKEMRLNSRINVSGKIFRIAGILKPLGLGEMGDSFGFMPLDVFRDMTGEKERLDALIVQIEGGRDIKEMKEKIEERLRSSRHVRKGREDFTVLTNEQIAIVAENIMEVLQLVLVGITGMALIIGAVGIMNTMYTSTYEKTKEIGIMKAIGARDSEIMALYLVESSLLGLGGGVVGLALGLAVTYSISSASQLFIPYIGWELILGTLAFSIVIGIASGLLPAKRAAELDPIEALRHD